MVENGITDTAEKRPIKTMWMERKMSKIKAIRSITIDVPTENYCHLQSRKSNRVNKNHSSEMDEIFPEIKF